MGDTEFKPILNFEEIIELAKEEVISSGKDYRLNFSLKVVIDIERLRKPQLLDAQERAENWQKIEKPALLYFNHGEYITAGGIPHVINELKNKHNGNRAIMSLISQRHVIGSGDDPIPSFMVLQFSLEADQLYVTTYFRALEVSEFLRINLEEIRIISKQIYEAFRSITKVRLNVFAFRAYITKDFNPLERPKIELLEDIDILTLMEKRPKELGSLLREKLKVSTVIENNSLMIMSRIINHNEKIKDVKPCFQIETTKRKLQECLDLSTKLIDMRKSASHAKDLDELRDDYLKALKELIEEIEK
jgi:hypothetical protein